MDRGGRQYYYHQNALWSVEAVTDTSASAVERYSYDAYGSVQTMDGAFNPISPNPWGTPHSTIGNPWVFTGRQFDEETGLYFYRARYYDPGKGRFLQRDPFRSEGANLYGYVSDNSVNGLDSTGLWEWSDLWDNRATNFAGNVGVGAWNAVKSIPGGVKETGHIIYDGGRLILGKAPSMVTNQLGLTGVYEPELVSNYAAVLAVARAQGRDVEYASNAILNAGTFSAYGRLRSLPSAVEQSWQGNDAALAQWIGDAGVFAGTVYVGNRLSGSNAGGIPPRGGVLPIGGNSGQMASSWARNYGVPILEWRGLLR
jgi:RHS repeat-associated protein